MWYGGFFKKMRAMWALLFSKGYFLVTVQDDDLQAKVAVHENSVDEVYQYIKDLMAENPAYSWLN
jgi:hypothetical protein